MEEQERSRVEQEIRGAQAAQDLEGAVTRLIEGYGPEILAFCAGRLRSRQDADEVFSLFCEDVWRGLPGFQWRSTARAWAYTLARHAMSRHVASAQRRARRDVPLSRSPELVARVRSATATLLRTGIKQELRALIERLPAEDQLLLTLRLERRLAFRELAVVLSDAPDALNEAAVTREAARLRKRYQLVKDRLRAMSIEAGLLASEG